MQQRPLQRLVFDIDFVENPTLDLSSSPRICYKIRLLLIALLNDIDLVTIHVVDLKLDVSVDYKTLVELPQNFLKRIGNLTMTGMYDRGTHGTPSSLLHDFLIRTEKLPGVFKALSNLTELNFAHAVMPECITLLSRAPLTRICLQNTLLTQLGLVNLAKLVKSCKTLHSFVTNYIKYYPENAEGNNPTPLFQAVAQNPSIRRFLYWVLDNPLGNTVYRYAIALVQQTKTLRELALIGVPQDWVETLGLFKALSENSSIELFLYGRGAKEVNGFQPGFQPLDRVPATRDAVTFGLQELLQRNRVLRSMNFLIMYSSFELLFLTPRKTFFDAINHNPTMHTLCLGEVSNAFKGRINEEDAIQQMRDRIANILKAARTFSVAGLIRGKNLPNELFDNIVRQVTRDSIWNDEDYWKVIRRVALDRCTIGKLIEADDLGRPLDPYEFLYRCRCM